MVTLCPGGRDGVHFGDGSPWPEQCPKCGKGRAEEELAESSAGGELGFNKSAPTQKTGVRSCSSFSWAMTAERYAEVRGGNAKAHCRECGSAVGGAEGEHVIEDEYGDKYTVAEFQEMLVECPLQFVRSVGEWFS